MVRHSATNIVPTLSPSTDTSSEGFENSKNCCSIEIFVPNKLQSALEKNSTALFSYALKCLFIKKLAHCQPLHMFVFVQNCSA